MGKLNVSYHFIDFLNYPCFIRAQSVDKFSPIGDRLQIHSMVDTLGELPYLGPRQIAWGDHGTTTNEDVTETELAMLEVLWIAARRRVVR